MIGLFVDIETTGWLKFKVNEKGDSVLDDESEILEVGYMTVNMDTKKILKHGSLYFYKDYFNVESQAQQIHGLTRDFLVQYRDDFDKNLIILNSLIQSTCLVGKNSDKFDIPFIKAFIEKHGGSKLNIPELVWSVHMKGYRGGTVSYNDTLYALDMQTIYKERFHELYEKKYGMPCLSSKKGKLGEYIDVLPGGQQATDIVYNSLTKDRVGGAHTALYDVVMTYIVWCDAKNNKLY